MAMVGRAGDRGRSGIVYGRDYSDIFPALGAFVAAGISVALSSTAVFADLAGRSIEGYFLPGILGAIVGLFAGLGWAVSQPVQPLRMREPEPELVPDRSPQLWDPWLDGGRDIEWVDPEVAREEPAAVMDWDVGPVLGRASVRPRIISPETGEAIPLEDAIGLLIQAGRFGLITIAGGPGSGKSTALRHLAAILPPWARDRVRLLDQPDDGHPLDSSQEKAADFVAGADRQLIILVPRNSSLIEGVPVYRLASWGQDDLIEYLLAVHPERCNSVMVRLRASGDRGYLNGIPELWTVVLDRMAGDESIGDLRTALRRDLAARLDGRPALRERVEDFCLDTIRQTHNPWPALPVSELPRGETPEGRFGSDLARLIRHRATALVLAADKLASLVESGLCGDLTHRFPPDLVQEAARLISGNIEALQHLGDWMTQDGCRPVQPLAASLLHAATPGWRPDPDRLPRLEGAYLDRVEWSGLNLKGVDLRNAAMREADLSAANLKGARLERAYLPRADLRGSNLTRLRAESADLSGADLGGVTAIHARFIGANLAGASLIEARLSKANLREADIEDANFTNAFLHEACLSGLALNLARFDGARFGVADLSMCNLEGMKLTDADFHDAKLRGALLTGSRMPGAKFLGADLRDSGLAEVDWPGACLRNADLRGATFHLGSSRNGLVGSPIASEGSRTGFYTDDYYDQVVKPAEEIRKANLRGADLRGANIVGVDFYLVDLREALYTPGQAEHLHRCRAILDENHTR